MRAKSPVRRALAFLPLLLLISSETSFAQPSASVGIKWEVKSRFRLFKNEDDFIYVKKFHGNGGVLAEETALAADTKGRGWAGPRVNRWCIGGGGLAGTCARDYAIGQAADKITTFLER